jgi:hypothetical protein
MDLFDLLWQRSQDYRIDEIRDRMERRDQERARAGAGNARISELAQESSELKLRFGLLVRLLISKGVFSAEEFAGLIAESRPKIPR